MPVERIAHRIVLVRGRRVLLDTDLAAIYGTSTKRFNEQVRRNAARFPEDFMFRLTTEEWGSLRSQIATLRMGHGQHRKYLPVYVVRAFVRLRGVLAANVDVARRLAQLEKKFGAHDQAIANLVTAIRELMGSPRSTKPRPIGFVVPKEQG